MASLAKLLTLIAVLWMPLGMMAAPAAAMPHHSASMPMQHCPDQAPAHGMKAGFAECTMACAAALPAVQTETHQALVIVHEAAVAVAVRSLHGLHPDTATPPPKIA